MADEERDKSTEPIDLTEQVEELEELGMDVLDKGLAAVNEYATEAEARDAAATLVESGVGATVEPVPSEQPGGGSGDGPSGAYRVMVLDHEVVRASRLLDLEVADDEEEVLVQDLDTPLEKPKAPWKQILLIWLAAMIILPILAFTFTYWVVSNGPGK